MLPYIIRILTFLEALDPGSFLYTETQLSGTGKRRKAEELSHDNHMICSLTSYRLSIPSSCNQKKIIKIIILYKGQQRSPFNCHPFPATCMFMCLSMCLSVIMHYILATKLWVLQYKWTRRNRSSSHSLLLQCLLLSL